MLCNGLGLGTAPEMVALPLWSSREHLHNCRGTALAQPGQLCKSRPLKQELSWIVVGREADRGSMEEPIWLWGDVLVDV